MSARERVDVADHAGPSYGRNMPTITIEPAAPARFDDAEHALTGGGDGASCQQIRIGRTREIAGGTREALDDASVWAVSCFVVRREHRGLGLTARLLDAAVVHARQHGARILEGYPIDPTVANRSANQLFRGVLSVFESAGFEFATRTKPERAIVSLTL